MKKARNTQHNRKVESRGGQENQLFEAMQQKKLKIDWAFHRIFNGNRAEGGQKKLADGRETKRNDKGNQKKGICCMGGYLSEKRAAHGINGLVCLVSLM